MAVRYSLFMGTNNISERIIKLPMWIGFDGYERVLDALSLSMI